MPNVSPVRWTVKKAARIGLVTASDLIGMPNLSAKPRLHVLTYHRFGPAIRDPFCVPRETFVRQMHWLARKNLAVSLEHLQAFVLGAASLPGNAVLVTIDDACSSVLTHALPVLRDFAIPAVVYVPAMLVGTTAPSEFGERVLRWDELECLQKSGVTIGSHGLRHRSLGQMPYEMGREEVFESRALLSSRLGTPVTSFAYPFGTRVHHNDMTRTLLRDAGYETGFTSQHGGISPGLDPLALPRVKIESGENDWMFQRICRGALNGWALVDAL